MHVWVLNCFSRVRLFATLWTVACQAPLSVGSSRQGFWSGLPCPPPGDLPNPGIKRASLVSPALAGGFFTASTTWLTCMVEWLPFKSSEHPSSHVDTKKKKENKFCVCDKNSQDSLSKQLSHITCISINYINHVVHYIPVIYLITRSLYFGTAFIHFSPTPPHQMRISFLNSLK